MSMKEYMIKVKGYVKKTNIRRSELRAVHYPLYVLMFKKSFKGQPMKPDDFLPINEEKAEREAVMDKDELLKKSFHIYNPHLKKN